MLNYIFRQKVAGVSFTQIARKLLHTFGANNICLPVTLVFSIAILQYDVSYALKCLLNNLFYCLPLWPLQFLAV
jgi:hypothetical protein